MKGVESLIEHKSVSELTLLDWYASFALGAFDPMERQFLKNASSEWRKQNSESIAKTVFDIAEACLEERKKRV